MIYNFIMYFVVAADCINRWALLRSRFSKERNKKTPSGSAAEKTEWPLMKYLAFLHSVVKRRRTFGNILRENSQSPWESQTYDEDLYQIEKDDSIEFTNYEYLEDETGIFKINLCYYFYIIFTCIKY